MKTNIMILALFLSVSLRAQVTSNATNEPSTVASELSFLKHKPSESFLEKQPSRNKAQINSVFSDNYKLLAEMGLSADEFEELKDLDEDFIVAKPLEKKDYRDFDAIEHTLCAGKTQENKEVHYHIQLIKWRQMLNPIAWEE